ncbi:MAG TPA: hypothetical protein VHV55_07000, partial [Pirellulales bacterium]|nr:hypothetical protein [Pirellulales bacterium]
MQKPLGVIDVAEASRALALMNGVVFHGGLRDQMSAATTFRAAVAIIRRTWKIFLDGSQAVPKPLLKQSDTAFVTLENFVQELLPQRALCLRVVLE